jgi:hypothetical protein
MPRKSIATVTTVLLICTAFLAGAQHVRHYNLVKLFNSNKLDTADARQVKILTSTEKQAISAMGIVWLKNKNFKEGTIDIDLRGKDVFLKSFLGIAFHAKDTLNYEVIFFRPFRFHSADVPTRKWSVQYVSLPGYDYVKLRKDTPGIYENEVTPVPGAEDWFHASIIIKGDSITVYVNHSPTPSLQIKKLNSLADGKIGLWTSGLSEDFADLSITE